LRSTTIQLNIDVIYKTAPSPQYWLVTTV